MAIKMVERGFYNALILLVISGYVLFTCNFKKTPLQNSVNNGEVLKYAGKKIKQCGEGYYLFYATFQDSFLSSKTTATIEDQIKWGKNEDGEDALYSNRLNSGCYGEVFNIDSNSYTFLKSKLSGGAVYFGNPDSISHIGIVKDMLKCSKKKVISSAAAVVTKINKITHAFILSNTNKENSNCQEEAAVEILNAIVNFKKQL